MTQEARTTYGAACLSLLAPGLGHVHLGRLMEGLAWAAGTALVGMLGTIAVLATPLWAGVALGGAAGAFVALWIAAAVSATRASRGAPSPRTKGADSVDSEEIARPWHVYALLVGVTFASIATWGLAVREKVVQVLRVPSASMVPTIQPGARVLVDEVAYRIGPVRRGDLVIFVNPNARYERYIKRVIALPGETVEMRGDEVFVNGAALAHERPLRDSDGSVLVQETNGEASYRVCLGPEGDAAAAQTLATIKVPNGDCFLLGDNRHHSADSRAVGPVPLVDLVGRVDRVF